MEDFTVTIEPIKLVDNATGEQLTKQILWAVDGAAGRISERYREARISLARMDELEREMPAFFKRISDIEDKLTGQTSWAEAVPLIQSWAKNWDFLIDQCVPPAKRVNPHSPPEPEKKKGRRRK